MPGLPLFLLTIFVGIILVNAPLEETFGYNPDEENNIITFSKFILSSIMSMAGFLISS